MAPDLPGEHPILLVGVACDCYGGAFLSLTSAICIPQVILIHLSNITGLNDDYSPRTMRLLVSDIGTIVWGVTAACATGPIKVCIIPRGLDPVKACADTWCFGFDFKHLTCNSAVGEQSNQRPFTVQFSSNHGNITDICTGRPGSSICGLPGIFMIRLQ